MYFKFLRSEGLLKNGMKHSKPEQGEFNFQVYKGELDSEDVPCGAGSLFDSGDATYTGYFYKGKLIGLIKRVDESKGSEEFCETI